MTEQPSQAGEQAATTPPVDMERAAAVAHSIIQLPDRNPAMEAYHASEWEENMNDIIALRAQNEALYYKATHDELTGLLNRAGLMAELGDDLEKRRLLFVDGNNMKAINDKLGYDDGDQAIIGTAQVLLKSTRKNDLVARVGGDEFVIALAEEDQSPPPKEPNLRKRPPAEDDLAYIEKRIRAESDIYLATVSQYVDYGFDIAVGTAPWQGSFKETKALAEQNMKVNKAELHAANGGQYRKS